MHIKIYFGDKTVILCDNIDETMEPFRDITIADENEDQTITLFLQKIENDSFTTGIIFHSDFNLLKEKFFAHFDAIEAAGGIVENDKKEILFIYRLKKWDLPKGKVEPGEAIATTAIREVEEETGLQSLTLQKKIGETYHTYKAYEKYFIKTTHWYHITCAAGQMLQPQTEEDIEEVIWAEADEIQTLLNNTYPSIKDIFEKIFN